MVLPRPISSASMTELLLEGREGEREGGWGGERESE